MNNQKGMQIETRYSASVFDFTQVSTCETHITLQWNSSHALKLGQVFDWNFDNCLNKPKRFGTMIHTCKGCKGQLCGLTGWHPSVAKYQRWPLIQNEPHHCQWKPIVFLQTFVDLTPRHPNCKRHRCSWGFMSLALWGCLFCPGREGAINMICKMSHMAKLHNSDYVIVMQVSCN